MKTNTRLKTFRLAIKVKPTPLHPMFNEVEFAMLFAYVSYNDEQIVKTVTDESTAEMVLQMLRYMPYKVVGETVLSGASKPGADLSKHEHADVIERSKVLGIAFYLDAFQVGCESNGFETMFEREASGDGAELVPV